MSDQQPHNDLGWHGLPEDEIATAAYFVWTNEKYPHGKDQKHWDFAIQQLLAARLEEMRQARVAAQSPLTRATIWPIFRQMRHAIRVMTEADLNAALADRPVQPRTQALDNLTVAPLSMAINSAIDEGDYRLAATIFREGYAQILDYEGNHGVEMHKGALTFDVARAYLQAWDFFAAMHYFELAEKETRETTSDPAFSIYSFDLFEKNFWDAVQVDSTTHPIAIYNELWSQPYEKASALADYAQLSDDSKLAYIVASAERVRLQNIADHSGWDGSDALRLGYWSLAGDIARLLEVEVKHVCTIAGATPADTLLACLEQKFHRTALGDISKEIQIEIPKTFPRTPDAKTQYETQFDGLLNVIRDPTRSNFDRICHALYLLGFTRNQVAHRLDKSTKLFKQLPDARFLVDLFLSLCRVTEWKPI